jgi:hypothetical protein
MVCFCRMDLCLSFYKSNYWMNNHMLAFRIGQGQRARVLEVILQNFCTMRAFEAEWLEFPRNIGFVDNHLLLASCLLGPELSGSTIATRLLLSLYMFFTRVCFCLDTLSAQHKMHPYPFQCKTSLSTSFHLSY